jgi:hypothetical protein
MIEDAASYNNRLHSPDQKPLTLALSRRERELTVVIAKDTST